MITAQKQSSWQMQLEKWSVLGFCVAVVVVTVTAVMLLPTYVGPMLVVFVPAVTAVTLIALTEGKEQVRQQLFSSAAWHVSWKWVVVSLGVALALRLGVSLLGTVLGHAFQPGPFLPLLAMSFLFAAGEQIGWRGFALPRLLARGWSPLAAALLLGIPWALLHLPLTLPGKLSAGTPMAAQFLIMLALSVMVTWAYLAAERSLTPAVLLHGGQNTLVILNNGLSPILSGWLMAAVYVIAAVFIVLITRSRLGERRQHRDGRTGHI